MHTEDLSKAMFSAECILQQFLLKKKKVRRSMGIQFQERYTVLTIKHPPRQMVWGAFSKFGTVVIYLFATKKHNNQF